MSPIPISDVDVVLLCGGQGTRLRGVTGALPKVMVDVQGKPFLEHLLVRLASFGLKRFILSTGYQGHTIEEYFKDRTEFEIVIAQEQEPLGTAGGLKNCESKLQSDMAVVLNGDSLCDLDFADLIDSHNQGGMPATLVVLPPRERTDGGFVLVNQEGCVTSFGEREPQPGAYLSAGIYVFSRKVTEGIPGGRKVSLEEDTLPSLVPLGLHAYPYQGYLYDIGTPERFERFKKEWAF